MLLNTLCEQILEEDVNLQQGGQPKQRSFIKYHNNSDERVSKRA